jgi:branched-chain amino acid transport system ATP-binding protein
MAKSILQAENLNVYYGAIHAIKGISFEVAEGEIVTLIGANGAGKSTVLGTISGLLRSKTGSITFNGENISHTPAHKIVEKGLAQVPEGRRVFANMTVQENLEMGAFTCPGSQVSASLDNFYDQFPRLRDCRRHSSVTLHRG